MVNQLTDILTGHVIEDKARLTLRELCDSCAVKTEFIIELVDEGLIEVDVENIANEHFSVVTIQRVKKAKRLQRDLGINLAGVALAIELLDEIERLRSALGSR